MITKKYMPLIIAILLLAMGLGCSAGTLLVKAPLPTATPTKTPRPIFTPTLIPTETSTVTPTPSPTPIPTETPTLPPTDTPVPQEQPQQPAPEAIPPTNTPKPAAPAAPAAPAPPTATPAPTNTPVPSFACQAESFIHPTGSAGQTRFTALVWKGDKSTGFGAGQPGYVLKVVGPTGEFTSEVSGPGQTDSTAPGTGDNHYMNMKVEIPPYTPGVYKVAIYKDGQQFSSTVEFNYTASPMQYGHIQCIMPN